MSRPRPRQRPRLRLSAAGWIGLSGILVGALLLFLTSGTAAKVGLVVGLLSVAFLMAGSLPAGVLGGVSVGMGSSGAGPRSRERATPPPPDYIEAAVEPSERDWAEERARYAEKERDQRDAGG